MLISQLVEMMYRKSFETFFRDASLYASTHEKEGVIIHRFHPETENLMKVRVMVELGEEVVTIPCISLLEYAHSPFLMSIPFELGRFLGFKHDSHTVKQLLINDVRVDYINVPIIGIFPDASRLTVDCAWILQKSDILYFCCLPTISMHQIAKMNNLHCNYVISRTLSCPFFTKQSISNEHDVLFTETMDTYPFRVKFNPFGRNAIYCNDGDDSGDESTILFLGVVPPFQPQIYQDSSLEFQLQMFNREIDMNHEYQMTKNPFLNPRERTSQLARLTQEIYPVVVGDQEEILLKGINRCVCTTDTSEKLYNGLQKNDLLLGWDDIKISQLVSDGDDLKVVCLGEKALASSISNHLCSIVDTIANKSVNEEVSESYARFSQWDSMSLRLIHKFVGLIQTTVTFLRIKYKIPILVLSGCVSRLPPLFASSIGVLETNTTEFEFHSLPITMNFVIESFIPSPVWNFTDFIQSLELSMMQCYNNTFRALVDEDQANSIIELRNNHFHEKKITISGIQFNYRVHLLPDLSKDRVNIGDAFADLFCQEINQITIDSNIYTRINFIPGAEIQISI